MVLGIKTDSHFNLSLLEDIDNNGKRFKISLIHLFIMRSINDDYIISDIDLKGIRQLEEGTWNSYLGSNIYEYKKTIAYHLKVKATSDENGKWKYIEDYNALIKFRFEDSRLFKYFLYLLIFALTTSVIGNYIFKYLNLI